MNETKSTSDGYCDVCRWYKASSTIDGREVCGFCAVPIRIATTGHGQAHAPVTVPCSSCHRDTHHTKLEAGECYDCRKGARR